MRNVELPTNWKLPEEISRRLGAKAGKQRVITENEHVFIVLHKAPQKHVGHRESLFLWCQPDGLWHSSERGNGLAVLDEYLESYSKVEQALDSNYDAAHSAADYFALLENLSPVLRAVKNMRNTLQNARETAGEVFINYRDKAEELERSFELLYIDGKNALEFAVARKAEEQSELQKQALTVGHRLNIIMALFLPITAAASLLGMNIHHGLENSSPWLFAGIVVTCSVLGLAMKAWVTRTADGK